MRCRVGCISVAPPRCGAHERGAAGRRAAALLAWCLLSGSLSADNAAVSAAPPAIDPPEIGVMPAWFRGAEVVDEWQPPSHGWRPGARPAPQAERVEPNGESAPVNSAVRVTFSQPMDFGTVESRFQIQPGIEGTLTWLDDQTLRFQPVALAYDTTYQVELDGLSKSGEPLEAIHTWSFRTQKAPFTLTFNDCAAAPGAIQAILAALAERGLHAIFFPTGLCRDTYPWLVPTLIQQGHTVCNHTYSHPVLTGLSNVAIATQIRSGVATGCSLFRPPYGAWDGRVAAIAGSLGYQIFLWDVDTRDWAGTSSQAMVAAIRARGGIVLMHMHGFHTAEAIRAL